MSVFCGVNFHSFFFFFFFPACRESNGVSRWVSIMISVVYQAQTGEARGYLVFPKTKVLLRLGDTLAFFQMFVPF